MKAIIAVSLLFLFVFAFGAMIASADPDPVVSDGGGVAILCVGDPPCIAEPVPCAPDDPSCKI